MLLPLVPAEPYNPKSHSHGPQLEWGRSDSGSSHFCPEFSQRQQCWQGEGQVPLFQLSDVPCQMQGSSHALPPFPHSLRAGVSHPLLINPGFIHIPIYTYISLFIAIHYFA